MYDLQYVKKRRRRKIAALVALFSAVGVTALVIVSFLGRTVGSFTVALKNTDVNLSLSKTKSFDSYSSFLQVGEIQSMRETTFKTLPLAEIDSEKTDYDYGRADDNSLYYVKYTFFITNTGKSTAEYNLSVNITDRTASNDKRSRFLDDTLRVMVFQNKADEEDSHDYRVFAKEAADNSNFDINGKPTTRELISRPSTSFFQETEEYPLAESFISHKTVANYTVSNFATGDVNRYTIVLWLEGSDPQSKSDDEFPEGATIKLGVDISAYEKNEQ